MACVGVSTVAYGGARSSSEKRLQSPDDGNDGATVRSSAFLGDVLAFAASIVTGLHAVYYTRFAVPPFEIDPRMSTSPPQHEGDYEPLPIDTDDGGEARDIEPTAGHLQAPFNPPPFALYPNFILSLIGSTTFLLLWIPIPVMHWFSIGPTFHPPPSAKTWAYLQLIAMANLVSNSGNLVSRFALWTSHRETLKRYQNNPMFRCCSVSGAPSLSQWATCWSSSSPR